MDSHDNLQPDHPTDDLRAQKIADLKKAILDGTYHIEPEQVADKVIEHMLEPKT